MESSLVTTKGQIVIPKKIRDKYNFEVGVRVAFTETENGVLIQPLDKNYYSSKKGILPNIGTSSVWDWKQELRSSGAYRSEEPEFLLNDPPAPYKKPRSPKAPRK